jgi:hypothetical protein
MVLLPAGCAHLEHQSSEVEPHGLMVVLKPSDVGGEEEVVKLARQTWLVKHGQLLNNLPRGTPALAAV